MIQFYVYGDIKSIYDSLSGDVPNTVSRAGKNHILSRIKGYRRGQFTQ